MLTPRKHKQGFSLLEVTVALAIIGLCLTAILKVFTSSTRSVGLTSDYYKAMQIAESQMAMLLARSELVGSSDGTVDDYYEWQAEVSEDQAVIAARTLTELEVEEGKKGEVVGAICKALERLANIILAQRLAKQ